jgi:hypothetical protein
MCGPGPAETPGRNLVKGIQLELLQPLQTQPDRELLQADVPSRRLEPEFADSRV